MGIWLISTAPEIPAWLRRTPSISTNVWLAFVPRTNNEVCWPIPPFWAISTPGKRRKTSATDFDCHRSISARVTISVGASPEETGCGKRFAVTTRSSPLFVEVLSCAHPEKAVTDNAVSSTCFLIVMNRASKLNWRMPQRITDGISRRR
ncbi:hypothetical protein SRABI106_02507 [Rahnella aquatilis]|nr:hypothetical protein SRABI106_02507 [Rahnella aquatilis]